MRINYRDAEITFDGKPSAEIRSAMKYAGMRWSPSRVLWYHPRRRLTSEFTEALERMERRETGAPEPTVGVCWTCKAAQGRFRAHGASAPVMCDECHAVCAYCAEQNRLRGSSPNAEVIIRDPGEDAADRWNESHS